MTNFNRRKLLCAGIALGVPFGGLSLLSGCEQSTDNAKDNGSPNDDKADESVAKSKQDSKAKNQKEKNEQEKNEQESNEKTVQVQYLEIVTPKVEELCKQYSAIHGITFSEPVANFGNARTAKLKSGGLIGIRGPMRATETPVVRPYTLVEDIKASVAAAKDAGAEVAIPPMKIPGHGSFAIVINGGIECGLWQL